MLMNPNGVMFGQGAVVNVGSLIATTGNIDANNFMSTGGAQITGATGSIVNQGSITAQGAGLVALVAPSVTNRGSIIATGGTIALAGHRRHGVAQRRPV
jgi:large exoprotein involved in heme utilization and adhesion